MYQAIGKLKETISILHCSSNIHKDQSCQLKELNFFFFQSARKRREKSGKLITRLVEQKLAPTG